jgi:hypothetical protein
VVLADAKYKASGALDASDGYQLFAYLDDDHAFAADVAWRGIDARSTQVRLRPVEIPSELRKRR